MMNIKQNLEQLIGNTPMLKLQKLSAETGCTILGKCEFLNPGGSIKDRAALGIITDAIANNKIAKGGSIVESTAGNTGIGIALIANSLGFKTIVFMPMNQSKEKIELLEVLGVELHLTETLPYDHPNHYLKQAANYCKKLNAEKPNSAYFANQFHNLSNSKIHYETTATEIYSQVAGNIDGFVCAAGTGGTIAGVSKYLKQQNKDIKVALVDVQGSSLYSYVSNGSLEPSEGVTVTEGTGIGFVTDNFKDTEIDYVYQSTDAEALPLLYDLLQNQGLCLGSSTAINLLGAKLLAEELGPGNTIVTILCDIGQRYQSTVYNPSFLKSRNLPLPSWMS